MGEVETVFVKDDPRENENVCFHKTGRCFTMMKESYVYEIERDRVSEEAEPCGICYDT